MSGLYNRLTLFHEFHVLDKASKDKVMTGSTSGCNISASLTSQKAVIQALNVQSINQSINAFIKRQRSHENRRRLREELIYFMAGWSNRCVFSELRKAAGQDVTRRWCGREFQILGAAT